MARSDSTTCQMPARTSPPVASQPLRRLGGPNHFATQWLIPTKVGKQVGQADEQIWNKNKWNHQRKVKDDWVTVTGR